MASGIYMIKNLVNGKIYIGSAVNLCGRKNTHFHELRNNKHHSRYLQRAFNKYGEGNFVFDVLEYVENKESLIEAEQRYLDSLQSYNPIYGYNMCPNAKNCLGYKHSEEVRTRRSKFQMGRPGTRNGTHQSTEARIKISKSNKGKKRTGEAKQKYSESKKGNKNPNYGKQMSDEQKRKVSENSTVTKKVMCINTGDVFRSITDAGRCYGVANSNISAVCKGKRKRAKGLVFKYL